MKQNYDIIIVGAGIAGLACAQKCSESNRDFLLIEKSDRIGGRVGSLRNDSYVFDLGFQVYNTAYNTTNKLLRNKSDEFFSFLTYFPIYWPKVISNDTIYLGSFFCTHSKSHCQCGMAVYDKIIPSGTETNFVIRTNFLLYCPNFFS